MPALTESTLRRLLSEWISEPYLVTSIQIFEDELDTEGRPIPHCEAYRRKCEARLARLRQIAPEKGDLLGKCAAVLQALTAIAPSDKFYLWEALGESREYSGVSTSGKIVSFYSYPKRAHGA